MDKGGKTKAGTPYTHRHLSAVKAMHKNNIEGMEWIMLVACGLPNETFRADPYESAYLQGRRAVALDIAELLKVQLNPQTEGE